ncbi:electron transport complex subunit RsxG [Shewanella sp. SNU WT4]|uniref:electron transport complex subunit RsxG n=1 Tax=Shewanella sp. SNU WT4 TaxID=2590015 RepID=UPI00112B1237|nr:electron transport complex subunit RsxG [Shewanella sp. SNU WT4]QDF66944.1 electron transport complex subunit RsxG [Shewanella sp. SNU WT4]
MKKSMAKNAAILGLFALVCTAVVSLVDYVTKDDILLQQQRQLLSILEQIIPTDWHDNDLSQACTLLSSPALGTNEPMPAYIATLNGKPTAIAMETIAPDGYSGAIKIIVAVDVKGQVLGVRTLNHQETPGLGDKIEIKKSNWLNAFIGKMVSGEDDPKWRVKKDGGEFDQFTGATITPRAYVGALRRTIHYFDTNQDAIFNQVRQCEVSHD